MPIKIAGYSRFHPLLGLIHENGDQLSRQTVTLTGVEGQIEEGESVEVGAVDDVDNPVVARVLAVLVREGHALRLRGVAHAELEK